MPVRKPLEKVDVEALIDQGAKVKEEQTEKDWVIINLRISKRMLKEVDNAVGRSIGIKRTGWILQAIDEKLRK